MCVHDFTPVETLFSTHSNENIKTEHDNEERVRQRQQEGRKKNKNEKWELQAEGGVIKLKHTIHKLAASWWAHTNKAWPFNCADLTKFYLLHKFHFYDNLSAKGIYTIRVSVWKVQKSDTPLNFGVGKIYIFLCLKSLMLMLMLLCFKLNIY